LATGITVAKLSTSASNNRVNPEYVTTSRVAYVDCYQAPLPSCRTASKAVALNASVPVIANLGASSLPDWLVKATKHQKVLMLQTSVPEEKAENMLNVANELASSM
jgi:hypothetical protein